MRRLVPIHCRGKRTYAIRVDLLYLDIDGNRLYAGRCARCGARVKVAW